MTPPTPRQRVEAALRGGHADKVPCTIYECKIPHCTAEREMRNRGLCIVNRHLSMCDEHRPNVKTHTVHTLEDGRSMVREYNETPHGTLTVGYEDAGFTKWHHEYMFKTPDDYRALAFYLADAQFAPNYDALREAERYAGEDIIFRAALGAEPLQQLISSTVMAMETFCIEWMERRDELLRLFDIIVEKRRQVYPLVAASPAGHANYGGNVVPEIIGLETFEQYYVPHYDEAAEVMHKHGKLIGTHLDANCKLLSKAIAGTALDYIEAFSPAPDTDMTVAEARAAWPDKVLWLNYPSSAHLWPDDRVEALACDLVDQNGGPDGLLMGITEDIPEGRWRDSIPTIMDGLDRHAAENPERYATGAC